MMNHRWQFPDGQIVMLDRPFARAGVNYPENWLRLSTEQDRAALGLTPAPEPDDFDGRWYVAPGQWRSLAEVKAVKHAELAALRYARETAGLPLMGLRTDRESQALLTGAALAATLDDGYTVDWKTENGWMTLGAAHLLAAAHAVRAHVQACFSNERAHAQAIDALTTPEAVEAYDLSSGWPA